MEKISYKEAVTEIEEIISHLENDKPDVDELSASVKRVAELIKFCKGKLRETGEEVEKTLRSFDE